MSPPPLPLNPESRTRNPQPGTRAPEPASGSFTGAYTDAPEQHANLLLGVLQIAFWLFFHPSAWRSYIARMDPDLRPDFCLAELSPAQWRNPALLRLIWQGHLAILLFVIPLVGLLISLRGHLVPVIFALLFSVGVGLAIGASIFIVVGFAGGIAIGVLGGVGVGIIAFIVLGTGTGTKLAAVFGLLVSVLAGSAGSVMLGILGAASQRNLFRQLGGSVFGVMVGIGIIVVAIGAASLLALGVRTATSSQIVVGVFGGVAGGAVGGVAFGLRTRRPQFGLVLGLITGLFFGLVASLLQGRLAGSVSGIILIGLSVGALFALPYLLAERLSGAWAGAVGGGLGGGGGVISFMIAADLSRWPFYLLGLVGSLPGLTQHLWRPVMLYPFLAAWNLLLFRLDERRAPPKGRPHRLRWHAAFWDELQRLRWAGLDEHLVLVAERDPAEGQAAIEYLSTRRQRWAARAAQIEMDARMLERCAEVAAIGSAHRALGAGELEGPASALLRSFSRVSQDVSAALSQESAYNQRLALSAVEDRLDGLLRELTRSAERYAVRFRPIATRWRESVADHMRDLAEAVEARQEIDNPYVIGVPLTEQQEIFVGRTDISARIEQLLLDRRRPPLLLYGQRRMGKTSLLNNLGRLLPSTIVPLFVDLQGPASQAADHAGFLFNIARGLSDSAMKQRGVALPPLTREALEADPFTCFDQWLDEVEATLGESTALLALDEFEVLDNALTTGRFDETAVLGMLRHWIQHRPRFKVLLAGSHTLDELQRWASYLINVQVVQIGYLKADEARQLIERPVKDFALCYEPDASQRVLALTRGHPFLVQLLCAEIVALKNEHDPAVRRLARLGDVEAAVPLALRSGSFFFADIQRNQVDAAGLEVLRFVAAQGEAAAIGREVLAARFPEDLDGALTRLVRRDIIEPVGGGYHFQVELIRRWFAH